MASRDAFPRSNTNEMLEIRPGQNSFQFTEVEAIIEIPNRMDDSLGTGSSPRSFFRRLEESLLIQIFLDYPAPGSLSLRPTAWLDGVRGVAALGVYVFHTMGIWASIVPAWRSDDSQDNIFQMPALRTLFASGGAAVSIFFILSGYVLTHKSFFQMHSGNSHLITTSVLSSMFRRPFRLYLPPIALTFTEMLATRFGIGPPLNFTFVPESTFAGQFADWVKETIHFVDPVYNAPRALRGLLIHPKYEAVIWTIPLEFYGSLVCYFLLILLARVPRLNSSYRARTILLVALAIGSMYLGSWNNFCFMTGMLLADSNHEQEEKLHSLILSSEGISEARISNKWWLWWFVFANAFYVAGFPSLIDQEAKKRPMPGFETLLALTPMELSMEDHARFWWSISGIALLTATSFLFPLKQVFTCRPIQYLGRISFSLYLIHEFCVVLFGLKLQTFLLHIVGIDPPFKHNVLYWVVCIVWYFIFSMVCFALAAKVEKWVDARSVRFARWLEGQCVGWYKSRR